IRDKLVTGVQTCALPIYAALGGLQGAIATRADEVVAGLSPVAQAALPGVLRALATVASGTDQVALARAAPLASFPPGSDARAVEIGRASCRERVESARGG